MGHPGGTSSGRATGAVAAVRWAVTWLTNGDASPDDRHGQAGQHDPTREDRGRHARHDELTPHQDTRLEPAQAETSPADRVDEDARGRDAAGSRREDEEDLGVGEEDDRRPQGGGRGEAPGAFHQRPVEQPEREQGRCERPGLGAVVDVLRFETDRRKEEAAAEEGDPARHPTPEQERCEQDTEQEDREPVDLELLEQPARQELERTGGVRRDRQVVELERVGRPPLDDRGSGTLRSRRPCGPGSRSTRPST